MGLDTSAPDTFTLKGDANEPLSAFLTGDPARPVSFSALLEGVDISVKGDANEPLSAFLTGDPSAPVGADISAQLTGDPNTPISVQLIGSENAPITLKLEPFELTTTLRGDPNAPISTFSQFELLNFPQFTFDQIIELIETFKTPNLRIQFPINLNFAFSIFPFTLFGIDAITFKICGEPQIILHNYVPNAFERCEIDCESNDTCS